MKPVNIIRSFITWVLVSMFVLAITPKQVLHDLLTQHQHIYVDDKTTDWVGKDRFNCDDENFVAESPFVSYDDDVKLTTPPEFSVNSNFKLHSYFYLHYFFLELRGPPLQS